MWSGSHHAFVGGGCAKLRSRWVGCCLKHVTEGRGTPILAANRLRVRVETNSDEASTARLSVVAVLVHGARVVRRVCRLEIGDCGRGVACAAVSRFVAATVFPVPAVSCQGITFDAVDRGGGGACVVESWPVAATASLVAEMSRRGVKHEADDCGSGEGRAV